MTLLSEWIAAYPISANRYWRKTKQGRVYVSKEAQEYKNSFRYSIANLICPDFWLNRIASDDVSIHIKVLPKLNKDGAQCKKLIDLDNAIKITLDALIDKAYVDDKQVKRITAEYGQAKQDGGLLVSVYKF